ncbi:MAG TPA: hypothetical protein VJ813_10265 [Vicinamibacterales bacterium]|nr:hypothetical protein [Vicinamibacterales bacterium]
MKAVSCPFCGLVTDAPHKTQEACIGALQTEIAQTRDILGKVNESPAPASHHGEKNPHHP